MAASRPHRGAPEPEWFDAFQAQVDGRIFARITKGTWLILDPETCKGVRKRDGYGAGDGPVVVEKLQNLHLHCHLLLSPKESTKQIWWITPKNTALRFQFLPAVDAEDDSPPQKRLRPRAASPRSATRTQRACTPSKGKDQAKPRSSTPGAPARGVRASTSRKTPAAQSSRSTSRRRGTPARSPRRPGTKRTSQNLELEQPERSKQQPQIRRHRTRRTAGVVDANAFKVIEDKLLDLTNGVYPYLTVKN